MIYINGTSGFIAGNLIKAFPKETITSLPRKIPEHTLSRGDIFIQMASPSDKFDFENKEETITSMLDDVYHNIDIVKKCNGIFISFIYRPEVFQRIHAKNYRIPR